MRNEEKKMEKNGKRVNKNTFWNGKDILELKSIFKENFCSL